MIFYKNGEKTLDTNDLKLNFGVISVSEYKGSSEKLVITDSDNFDDSYVYKTGTRKGGSVTIECIVRKSKLSSFKQTLRESDRVIFNKEPNRMREFYLEGAIEYMYVDKEYVKLKFDLYLYAYKYDINKKKIEQTGRATFFCVNDGETYAEPVFKIYGKGMVTFYLNENEFNFKNCDGVYIIDCRNGRQNITNGQGLARNITCEYDGTFPKFDVGENKLSLVNGDKLIIEWEDRYL